MKYPSDLSDKHYLSIGFREYSRPSAINSIAQLVSSALASVGTGGSIKLPMPTELIDSQNLNWAQQDVGVLAELGAAGATIKFGQDIINTARDSSNGLGTLASISAGKAITEGALADAAQRATGTMTAGIGGSSNISDLLSGALQQSGLAINPILTVLFKHPNFKEHQFNWVFSPKSSAESQTLQSIINTIKVASLPGVAGGGAFFEYPQIAIIRLSDESTTYTFQPAVIQNVTVNYAAAGRPAFFAGKFGQSYPAQIQMTINFLEIILNTKNNYGGSAGFGMGTTAFTPTLNSIVNTGGGTLSNVLNMLK